jgi:hypothetical protein
MSRQVEEYDLMHTSQSGSNVEGRSCDVVTQAYGHFSVSLCELSPIELGI